MNIGLRPIGRMMRFWLGRDEIAGGHRRGTVSEAMLYAFDLLELDGEDLREMPLGDRKKRLARLIGRRRIGIVLSDHTTEDGALLFVHACRLGLEGIVSKRLSGDCAARRAAARRRVDHQPAGAPDVILWIESQPTALIAVLVTAFTYGIAAVIFLAMMVISRWRIAGELKGMTPVMLTPLAVIVGLLIAFLASRVWTNIDRATSFIAQEASAVREAILLSDALPEATRAAVRAAIVRYVQFIETNDWPAMAQATANLRRIPPGLSDAMTALLSVAPTGMGQQVAQQRAVIAIEQALQARRQRIVLSQTKIAPVQWVVVVLLTALLLLTIGIVHIDKPATSAVGMAILSAAVASCLVLLMALGRPFGVGGVTLEPTPLREVGAGLELD
jgi:hypothetical protein